MNWREVFNSKEFTSICIFGLILMLFGVSLHVADKTLLGVDQLYCRSYYPWKALHPEMNCSQEREADNIFESSFIATELDYLAKNPYQNSYTERITNGYPIASAYSANPYSLTRLLNRFLPITSSTNFVALFELFISALIGYSIARTLKFDPKYSILFGFLSITCAYAFLVESWNLSLIGIGLVILGILQYFYYDRKYLFIGLTFLGALSIILSAFFQLYIGTAICILLFGLTYFWTDKKQKHLYIFITTCLIFIATALCLNFFITEHLSFLSVSNKINTEVPFSEFMKKKDYAMDPIGWIGYEPVQINRKIAATLFGDKFGYYTYGAVATGNWSPGPVFMVLFFIGIVFLWQNKYRGYVLFSLFWLLYSAGYLQLFLSLTIGSPFLEETTSRASNIFFLVAVFAVIYAMRGLLQNTIILNKNWKRVVAIFFVYLSIALPVLIFIRYRDYKILLLESIYITISSILFLFWLYTFQNTTTEKNKKIATTLLVISLILPSFGRLFLRANPGIFSLQNSDLYYPQTQFGEQIKKYPDINRVSLIQTLKSGRGQEQNGPVFLSLNTVTTYRNPMYKHYTDLYYYHRFIFEGSKDATSDFEKLKGKVSYLNNDLGVLRAPQAEIKLARATELFFALTQVNAIIGSKDLEILNPGWEKLIDIDNLALWHSQNIAPEFFLTQEEIVIPENTKKLEYIFNDSKWDPKVSTVVTFPVLPPKTEAKSTGDITLIKKTDGYRLFRVENLTQSNILTLPVTFDKHWKATLKDISLSTRTLKTFTSNSAFLGILVPEGSGVIEVIYDDRPKFLNFSLSIIGVILLILLTRRQIYGKSV